MIKYKAEGVRREAETKKSFAVAYCLRVMPLKAIFFDAAGTLIKTTRPVGESYALLAKKHGMEVLPEEIRERFRFCFSSAPPLEIFSPVEGQNFKEKVVVWGKTDKDASVRIDGTVISISEDGSFKEEIVLSRGDNLITIETINRQGKKRVVSRKVKVE